MKRVFCVALLLFFCLSGMAIAQETRGTFSGSVADPTGAALPGAKVIATEVRTNTKTATVADASGQYNIPFLAPGEYELQAEMQGFKSFLRKGLKLGAGDHVAIDVKMEIGQTSQTVEVTADVPLVDTSNSSTGQSITTKQVEDFPLNGRNPMMVAQLAIGVIATGTPALVHPFDNKAASSWSIGGMPAQTAEIMMDGAPNTTWDNRMAYAPPQEAVQEVKVKAFDTDAAYGHTGSGTINKVMKTGTNALHGSAYWFTQPSALAANDFFQNRAGVPVAETKLDQEGFTAGGPVIIPKVYHGKDKLFWFFAYERLNDAQPNTKFLTVPTAAERKGDFSSLLTNGSNYQIYNPYSGVLTGSTVTRTSFQCDASGNPVVPNAAGIQAKGVNCNKIPSQLMNPIALAYLKFYPEPTLAGDKNGYSNYGNATPTTDDYNNQLGRLDWNMSERSKLSGNVRHNYQIQSKNDYFNNGAHGLASILTRENWGGTVDEVYTLSNSTVLNARVNYTRMIENHPSQTAGFDPTTLGFPSYIGSNSTNLTLPAIVFGNCGNDTTQATSFDCLGSTGASILPSQSWSLFSDVSKQWRSHTFKFGFDGRQYKLDANTYGASTGSYTFNGLGSSVGWTSAASNGSAAPFGQDFASFLLGLPSSGSYNISSRGTYTEYYYGLFFNDDWRVSHNLTLNLGLRWDHDLPWSEKLGRTVNGFDFTDPNPVSATALAAFTKNTLPKLNGVTANGVPVPTTFAVPGGLTFATPGNGDIWQNKSHLLSPRIGFAWAPDQLNGKTSIRGGFGLFVQPLSLTNLSPTGSFSSTPILTQEGFSQSTAVPVTTPLLNPTVTLSNPFPNGIAQPAGSTAGLGTFLGQSLDFLAPNAKNPYAERWTLGVQQMLGSSWVVEAAYIGNHAVHLPIQVTQLNPIPRKYLSTGINRDNALNTALTASYPNPFAGTNPSGSLNGANTSLRQLLAQFPEFPVASDSTSFSSGVVEHNLNVGSSNFNSLNLRVEKRMSKGLTVVENFIWSKLIETDSWLNNTDTRPERRISTWDHPVRFVTAVSYELPIGRGKLLNLDSRLVDSIVGGWQVNGIYTWQSGAPLQWTNGSTNNPGDYALCSQPTAKGTVNALAKGLCVDEAMTTIFPAQYVSAQALGFNSRQVAPGATSFDTSRIVTGTSPSSCSAPITAAQCAVLQSAGQFAFHIRTLPTTNAGLRQDANNNFDASVIKKFSINERMYFQFRAEAFNVLNHPTFNAPNLVATNSAFGTITGQANRPRQLQLGLRFVF